MSLQILVPLDGSDFSEQALDCACEIAQRARGDLHLVRVQELTQTLPMDYGGFNPAAYGELTRDIGEYLVRHAVRLSRAFGPATRAVTLHGPVASAIAAYVEENRIDLVVMTSHGRTGVSRALLGSVADALARTLPVPLLLLRPVRSSGRRVAPPFNPRRILIPLDGSEFAEQIIEQAVELGWPARAEYTLLQILNPALPDANAQLDDSELQYARQLAEEYLGGVAEWLRGTGLSVRTVVAVHQDTAAGILQESTAADVDLIAMATHGRGGWRRLLLGSVAERVLHSARLPLLVLKGREAEASPQALTASSFPWGMGQGA